MALACLQTKCSLTVGGSTTIETQGIPSSLPRKPFQFLETGLVMLWDLSGVPACRAVSAWPNRKKPTPLTRDNHLAGAGLM